MEAIQDNGTFQSSEELLRDGIAPQQVMSNLISAKPCRNPRRWPNNCAARPPAWARS